jgi:hypothetical protein
MNLAPRDVEGLLDELGMYHKRFSGLFRREEQWHWAGKYLEGLLLEIPCKAIEPIAERLAGGNVRAMQQFVGTSGWQDSPIVKQHQRLVEEGLGEPEGVVSWMTVGSPSKAKPRWASNGNDVAFWAKWPIAKWACLSAMRVRGATHW